MMLATISRIGSPVSGGETGVVVVMLAEVGVRRLVVDGILNVVVTTGVPTSAPSGTVTLFKLDTELFKAEALRYCGNSELSELREGFCEALQLISYDQGILGKLLLEG
jgi:hypothetical protein